MGSLTLYHDQHGPQYAKRDQSINGQITYILMRSKSCSQGVTAWYCLFVVEVANKVSKSWHPLCHFFLLLGRCTCNPKKTHVNNIDTIVNTSFNHIHHAYIDFASVKCMCFFIARIPKNSKLKTDTRFFFIKFKLKKKSLRGVHLENPLKEILLKKYIKSFLCCSFLHCNYFFGVDPPPSPFWPTDLGGSQIPYT